MPVGSRSSSSITTIREAIAASRKKARLNLQDEGMDIDENEEGFEETSMTVELYVPNPNHQLHLLPKYLIYNILEYMVNVICTELPSLSYL